MTWYELFLRYAGLLNRRALVERPPLAPARAAALSERIDAAIGPAHWELLEELEDEAEAIPLSQLEERIITLEPGTIRPEDDPLYPVALTMGSTAIEERVATLWDSLDGWLERDERTALLHWGEKEHVAMGGTATGAAWPPPNVAPSGKRARSAPRRGRSLGAPPTR